MGQIVLSISDSFVFDIGCEQRMGIDDATRSETRRFCNRICRTSNHLRRDGEKEGAENGRPKYLLSYSGLERGNLFGREEEGELCSVYQPQLQS